MVLCCSVGVYANVIVHEMGPDKTFSTFNTNFIVYRLPNFGSTDQQEHPSHKDCILAPMKSSVACSTTLFSKLFTSSSSQTTSHLRYRLEKLNRLLDIFEVF